MSAKLTDITVLIEIIKNALHTQSIFCIRPKVEIISYIIMMINKESYIKKKSHKD